jgi:hypothetical protein
LAAPLHNHAFKRLHAFLFLLAIGFFQDHVDPDGVARAEIGEVFAQLRLLRFYKYWIHSFISRQTRSGGASTLRTINDYTQMYAIFPQKLNDMRRSKGRRPLSLLLEPRLSAILAIFAAKFFFEDVCFRSRAKHLHHSDG